MRPPWILHPHGYMNYIPWYIKSVLFISLRSATDIFHDSVEHDVERDIKGYQVFTRRLVKPILSECAHLRAIKTGDYARVHRWRSIEHCLLIVSAQEHGSRNRHKRLSSLDPYWPVR